MFEFSSGGQRYLTSVVPHALRWLLGGTACIRLEEHARFEAIARPMNYSLLFIGGVVSLFGLVKGASLDGFSQQVTVFGPFVASIAWLLYRARTLRVRFISPSDMGHHTATSAAVKSDFIIPWIAVNAFSVGPIRSLGFPFDMPFLVINLAAAAWVVTLIYGYAWVQRRGG